MSRSINYADFLEMLGTYGDYNSNKNKLIKDRDKHYLTRQQTNTVKKADTKSAQSQPK